MALPFATLKPVETVVVAGIPLTKRGCLTISEVQSVADLSAEQESLLSGKTALQADLILKQRVVTILLRSRVDRDWTLEHTVAPQWEVEIDGKVQSIEPDAQMLDELFQFFMGEQRQWQDAQPGAGEEPEKKPPTGRKSTGS